MASASRNFAAPKKVQAVITIEMPSYSVTDVLAKHLPLLIPMIEGSHETGAAGPRVRGVNVKAGGR